MKCNKIITKFQEDLNLEYKNNCTHYTDILDLNFNRAMYSEFQCVTKFPINVADTCVMVSSDSYILKDINLDEIENSIKYNYLYTTNFNQYGGIANGFYITTPKNLQKICKRLDEFPIFCSNHLNSGLNAEIYLKHIIDKYEITNKDSSMLYLKIRANGKPNHYGDLIKNKLS